MIRNIEIEDLNEHGIQFISIFFALNGAKHLNHEILEHSHMLIIDKDLEQIPLAELELDLQELGYIDFNDYATKYEEYISVLEQ